MNSSNQIQFVLFFLTYFTLGGLVLFQFLQYVIGAWRHWANRKNRLLWTLLVAIGWILYGGFFLTIVPAKNSYVDAIPLVLAGLYTPTVLVLIGLIISSRFRSFVDGISLRWAIESVEGPARMIVGIIFLFWYFAGGLPAVVAWIAGPGDWIAGFIAFYAVKQLQPVAESVNITGRHWSMNDYIERQEKKAPGVRMKTKFKRNLFIATAFVMFGVLDFIAAPASTAVSIAWGSVPEAMGQLPLAFIPLLLVPQVLVLEVIALRQFYVFYKYWKD